MSDSSTRNHILHRLAEELEHDTKGVQRAISLLDEGNTVPFIARYRKEATGEMDEKKLRQLGERLRYLRDLEERREQIRKVIEEAGALTEELASALDAADSFQVLEDLYLPYRPKRRTRASMAREKGLEPLAEQMLAQRDSCGDPAEIAAAFSPAPDGEELDPSDALSGAADIVIEWIAEDSDIRGKLRKMMENSGVLHTEATGEEDHDSPYGMYADFSQPIRRIPPHRTLAIDRGEREEKLRVRIRVPEDEALRLIERRYLRGDSIWRDHVEDAGQRALRDRLLPAMERGWRRSLTEDAHEHAVQVFGRNLRQLLLQAPLRDRTVVGIDPAFRTGCKVAVVDPTGAVLHTGAIYPHPPQKKWRDAGETLLRLIEEFSVDVIAIGNGTASRETESLAAEIMDDCPHPVHYAVIDEAGASVYSASETAAAELPDLDVSLRGAVSIARRIQDPLAELVKIDPRSLGVGLYQHDVSAARLRDALDQVVESCVNSVGVDVNTASIPLLARVSGLGPSAAEKVVSRRGEIGTFDSRNELLSVPGIGPKTFQQSAGFLRVRGGEQPLDDTWVHPESYDAAHEILDRAGLEIQILTEAPERVRRAAAEMDPAELAEEMDRGEPTIRDILAALARPGRDPREDMPAPILRTDILTMQGLQPGQVMLGTVRNVVDFGAFVDIGVERDGLVHISEMSDRYLDSPHEAVAVADVVTVRVQDVDHVRKRISLSMRNLPSEQA